ncbi:hypothetical protein C1Y63_10115 [Corynebacterium sp. 13CS0277]|uniref:aminotransferase class I/II-fold pyridoxal phosphate-dependent enzyme n=1 Tax=Corynebacterium sp. 13CS0277 TaxID=2071994 RepID=UPI000D03A8FC|nr:aminotransferase class I/II-fold pyridoxal phosphate-dependent enzyme [Corynebacterium sp. 13CS0277]PRQ10722.1 hypothetical protein C1Y63_10115 [Corynebacterium sp. 13CS0277]
MNQPPPAADGAASSQPTAPAGAGRAHHGDDDARGATIDFAVNVRSTRPPAALEEALAAELPRLGAYPDRHRLAAATAAIAARLGVPAERTLLLSGASEGFALLPALLRRGLVVHPGFSEPEDALRAQGVPTRRIVLPAPWDGAALEGALAAAPPRAGDGLIIGNPTNPTGRAFDPELLARLAGPGLLIVDEAFADVSPGVSSALPLAAARERVLVLRSLTKTFALAGLRCGVAVGHPDLLAALAARRPHWPLSSLQLAAVEWAAQVADEHYATIAQQAAEEKAALLAALAPFGITAACPSAAPYVLVRLPWPPEVCRAVRERLRARGVAVRRCDTFPGLGEQYWRLAARGADAREGLVAALRHIVDAPPRPGQYD